MKSSNSNLIVGLAIGAALGAAVGALMVSAKSHHQSVGEELEDLGKITKKKVTRAVKDGIDELEAVSDKLTREANKLINKVTK